MQALVLPLLPLAFHALHNRLLAAMLHSVHEVPELATPDLTDDRHHSASVRLPPP